MDAQLIVQVIVNLIDNALKYTEQGSEICASAEKQGKYAVIRVADNGSGIPDDMKSHIFEMFYTGTHKIVGQSPQSGTWVVAVSFDYRGARRKHPVEDNHPHGCIFTFTLPAEEVALNE